MPRESKLVELQRKTDEDLLALVRRELDRGLTLADVAATIQSPLCAKAERAYRTVKAWLPLISGRDRDERRELEFRLKELRAALDRIPSEGMQRHFMSAAASQVSRCAGNKSRDQA
jgi:hypothetical protein